MIRRAFVMRLKEGALDEYIQHHDTIWEKWPGLVEEMKKSGIHSITTFEDFPNLFLFSEVEDETSWDKLWHSAIHDQWSAEAMNPLMFFRPDGIVESKDVREIFHLEPFTGPSAGPKK
jgi:L-rhamnose mutarotase